jgi:hypothetical protein
VKNVIKLEVMHGIKGGECKVDAGRQFDISGHRVKTVLHSADKIQCLSFYSLNCFRVNCTRNYLTEGMDGILLTSVVAITSKYRI